MTGTSFAGTIEYDGPFGDPNGMNGWADPNGGGTVWYAGVSESNTVMTQTLDVPAVWCSYYDQWQCHRL